MLFCFGKAAFNLLHFRINVHIAANMAESAPGQVTLSLLRKPAWALGKKDHPQRKNPGGNYGQTKHPAPSLNAGECVVHQISEENSNSDCQLEQRDLPAPRFGWRNLGYVYGNGSGREADADAHH